MHGKIKNRKWIKRVITAVVVLLSILMIGFYIYTLDYYKASSEVIEWMEEEQSRITTKGNLTTILPSDAGDTTSGFIFYPGGKVEAIAYIPLLEQIADKGITVVLVEMPFNLAVFNINGADKVYDKYPEIETWYISGHSLGGAMASQYVGSHDEAIEGLILLGAYPVNESVMNTLVLYGENDQVLNMDKLESSTNIYEIEGGNHAYFGNYGEQKGDGEAEITREEQQRITVERIIEFILD